MKKLLLYAFLLLFALPAFAGPTTKGDVQRLDLDFIKIDGTAVTSSGAELNILDGVNATATEINKIADDSARLVSISANATADCSTNGSGRLNLISAAAGTANVTVTLPAATGSGCKYRFMWPAAPNSAGGFVGDVIQVTGDDSFNGAFWMTQDSGNTSVAFETASDTDKLTFTSTQGAAVLGVWIEFFDYAADKWLINGNSLIGTGTEATPGATGQRS